MKIAPTTIMNRFLRLTVVCVACVVVVGHGHLRDAEAESRRDRTGDSREGLFVTFRDIFHGGADRPDSATSSVSSSGRGDRLLRNIGKGISERARQVSGAVSNVSGMKQRVTELGAVAQRLRGQSGNGIFRQGGNDQVGERLRDIAGAVQSGAQVAGGLHQIRAALQGGEGLQKISGVARGVSRIGSVAGRFGGGSRNGPFGQFMGQNNQLMQGMGRFLGLLQQILGLFGGGGSPFNPSNTGRSAGMAFANLMGAQNGSPFAGLAGTNTNGAIPAGSVNHRTGIAAVDFDGTGYHPPGDTFEPATALKINGKYLNGDVTPYVVINRADYGDIPLGSKVYVFNRNTGMGTWAIAGDRGPSNNGRAEISVAAANAIGAKISRDRRGNMLDAIAAHNLELYFYES